MTDHQVGDVIFYVTTAPFPGDGIDIITHLADGIATLRDGPYLFTEEIRETIKTSRVLPTRDPRCGEPLGYKAHRTRGEEPCDACRRAHCAAVMKRRKERKAELAASENQACDTPGNQACDTPVEMKATA